MFFPIMPSRSVPVLTCVLLLLTLCPEVLSRRSGFGGIGGRWGGIGRAGGGGGGGGGWGGVGAHRGGGGGVGGGHHYKVAYGHGGSSSSGSSSAGKIAGAAAAGALGGMVIGHGLGSMSRPGYAYGHGWHGGHGYDGHGYAGGHGHPRYAGGHGNGHVHHEDGAGIRNETDMEYYTGSASRGQSYSCVMMLGATVSFFIRSWSS